MKNLLILLFLILIFFNANASTTPNNKKIYKGEVEGTPYEVEIKEDEYIMNMDGKTYNFALDTTPLPTETNIYPHGIFSTPISKEEWENSVFYGWWEDNDKIFIGYDKIVFYDSHSPVSTYTGFTPLSLTKKEREDGIFYTAILLTNDRSYPDRYGGTLESEVDPKDVKVTYEMMVLNYSIDIKPPIYESSLRIYLYEDLDPFSPNFLSSLSEQFFDAHKTSNIEGELSTGRMGFMRVK
ncbi:MAG: hypothetical protein GY870_10000 [archaeon]|nr:hypothetical protein [archaeon]